MHLSSSVPTPALFKGDDEGVVEISLLLPSKRAHDLIELSVQRQQTVAQILRQLIDRALQESECVVQQV